MIRLPPELTFELVQAGEVPAAHELEISGFPADEVTPIDQFRFRQEHVPSFFVGAFMPSSTSEYRRTIIGFVCATRSALPTYTAASMKGHDPEGTSVCIHNVVVASAYQRRGIALALAGQIVARVRNDGLTKLVLLICHDNVRPLYEKAGFVYVGLSPIILGHQQWVEMCLVVNGLANNSDTARKRGGTAKALSNGRVPPQALTSAPPPNGLIRASQGPSAPRNVIAARLMSSFASGLGDVTIESKGVKRNKYEIVCPRKGCGSIILKANVGHLVEKELPESVHEAKAPPSLLTSLPSAGPIIAYWLVQPNPMAFENIGFSHPVGRRAESKGAKPKLLNCVDCDLGPIGWCVEGGNEFWLICSRVGYRA